MICHIDMFLYWIHLDPFGGFVMPSERCELRTAQEQGHELISVEATKTRWECRSCRASEAGSGIRPSRR